MDDSQIEFLQAKAFGHVALLLAFILGPIVIRDAWVSLDWSFDSFRTIIFIMMVMLTTSQLAIAAVEHGDHRWRVSN